MILLILLFISLLYFPLYTQSDGQPAAVLPYSAYAHFIEEREREVETLEESTPEDFRAAIEKMKNKMVRKGKEHIT